MAGKSDDYCTACIDALLRANTSLTQTNVSDLLKRVSYGKSDTYALDAAPEIQIKACLSAYDPDSVLVTEELGSSFLKGWPDFADIKFHPSVFFCDPTDRSSHLIEFLKSMQTKYGAEKFGTLLTRPQALMKWKKIAGGPPSITGSTGSITCVRRGRIVFSVLLNYITQELVVACSSGIFIMQLKNNGSAKRYSITLADVIKGGRAIGFNPIPQGRPWDNSKFFTTFLGSPSKTGYAGNMDAIDILSPEDRARFSRYEQPGGPARILYLSSLRLASEPIGFILANGEKITEWIHWIPFVRFARYGNEKTLRLFEISHSTPQTKDGILMSTSPIYSVFQQFGDMVAVDVNFLRRFPNPSKYRSTLIVAPLNNEWVNSLMLQHCYREIILD